MVTSPTGAVIRDILHRLADRFPRRVLVWPVPVQGERAAAEIAGMSCMSRVCEPGASVNTALVSGRSKSEMPAPIAGS